MNSPKMFSVNDPEFLEIIEKANESLQEMFPDLADYVCLSMQAITASTTGFLEAVTISEISGVGNIVMLDDGSCDMKFLCSIEDPENPTVFELQRPFSNPVEGLLTLSALGAVIRAYKTEVGDFTDSEGFRDHITETFKFGEEPMFCVSTQTQYFQEQILSTEVLEYLETEGFIK